MPLNFSSISDVQIFNLIKRYGDHNFQNQKWIQKWMYSILLSCIFSCYSKEFRDLHFPFLGSPLIKTFFQKWNLLSKIHVFFVKFAELSFC